MLDDDVNGSAPSITDLLIHRGVGTYEDHGVEQFPTHFDFTSILGGIQQLRGQNFDIFDPPSPCVDSF